MNLSEPASSLDFWALSPEVEHLNHGSFGGCPLAVIDAATSWRERLEAAPMKFYVLDWQRELDAARHALSEFLHTPSASLAFIPNATTGVALALASSTVEAGDELLTTSHAYRACVNQLTRLAASRRATIRVVQIDLPYDPDAVVDAISRAITARTRLALLDHITSPTGLILPLERIVPLLAGRGIPIIVDGAHAPGQLPLDVGALLQQGVTWYTGNHHKWVCAPKATAFLAAAATAPAPQPLVTSHGATPEYGPPNRFHAELDWMGTYDPSAHLAVPAAITTVANMGNGWPTIYARNHALAVEMRDCLLAGLAGAAPLTRDDSCFGTMAAIPITLPPNTRPLDLERCLLADGWEIPIVDFKTGPLVRISAHLYNHVHEADALAAKLRSLGVTGRAVS